MSLANLRALAGKELHHLLPLIVALSALEILGLLEWFVAQSPDEITWVDVSVLLDPEIATIAGFVYVMVGIITAYMMLPHEKDQNTLEFLWSLPVARWQIYAMKMVTAFAVLAGLLVIGHLLMWWVHTFGVSSISSAQFSWQLWSWELASLIGLAAITLGYGALVACFRIVGILAFIALWAMVQALAYVDTSYEYLDVSTLLIPEYRGTEVLLNTKTWTVHSAIALFCVVLAGFLWTRDSRPPADHKRMRRWGSRIATGLFAVLALVFIIAYGTITLAPGFADRDVGSVDATSELEAIETQYYEISYYAKDRTYAQLLQKDADQHSRQVQQLLDTKTNERTLADLTDNSADHLGIAGWKKLRIRRSALYDPEQRSHVFVHESTHVLAAAASNRRLRDHNDYTLFFNEGLAEWVSYEILGLDEQRHALRLLAALAWKRFDLRFSDFLYATPFRARFDENLIYALGEAWVSTLAEVCGNQAPGAVLRAMARPNAPQQLQGHVFWRDTLQVSGCDLTAVNGRFALSMRDYQSEVAPVPVLSGAIDVQDARLVVSLTLAGTELGQTYKVYVRVRDNPQASPAAVYSQSAELQTGKTLDLELPRVMISGERFQYQLGVEFLPGERPFFGRWIDEG